MSRDTLFRRNHSSIVTRFLLPLRIPLLSDMARHSSGGGGIAKAKFGVKKLQRKNKSNRNLPYLKPFRMALLCRRKQKQHTNGVLATRVKKPALISCVNKAAKICHSPKLEDRYPMQDQEAEDFILTVLTEDFILKMKEINKYKVPTYGGYSPDYKEEVQPLHFPTLIKRFSFIFRSDDK